MKCPQCQTDNPYDSKFCKECATPLPSAEGIPVTKTLETPTQELTRGTTFAGRYEIIEELGKGGMGNVYRVFDKKIQGEVALKLVKPEIAADKKTIERFRNELKIAREIAHRSVCRMYDLNEAEGVHYITMEYVAGEDLKSFIRRAKQLTAGTAVSIARQVGEGLEEAHRLGVVHRDLKPQNIMIDKEGNARIMDFGIARSLKEKGITGAGVIIGTPDYMSPEQAEAKEVDHRSDIYSLGIILYEMAAGRVPFEGETPLSVALKHKSETPKDPREYNAQIPEGLSRLILRCLEKDKEKRYQTAAELLADLARVEEGIPTTEHIVPKRKPLTSKEITVKFTLRKLAVPAAILAVFVITALLLWHFSLSKKAPIVQTGKPSLAILYFRNMTGDQSLDIWREGLAELMTQKLYQSKYLNVIPSDQLVSVLRKRNLQEAKTYAREDLQAIARESGATHVVQGSLAKAGDNFRINLTLQEATTGKVLRPESADGKGEQSFFAMVDLLADRLKQNFDLTADQIAADISEEIGEITTSSPEAWKYYIEGRKEFNLGNAHQSIEWWKKAVELDPKFGMAYRAMSVTYGGYLSDYHNRDLYMNKALEASDHLPLRERLLVQAVAEKDPDKEYELYKKVLENYPEDMTANMTVARYYRVREEWEMASRYHEVLINNKIRQFLPYGNQSEILAAQGKYEEGRELLESYHRMVEDRSIYHELAAISLSQGKYDLAVEEAEKHLSLLPADHRIMVLKGDAYLLQGDFVKAEESYNTIFELESQVPHLAATKSLVILLTGEGKFQKALDQAGLGADLAQKLQQEEWETEFRMGLLASLYRKTGHPTLALEEYGNSKLDWVLHEKGLTYLEMKSIQDAEAVLETMRKLFSEKTTKNQQRYIHHLTGRIELEKGNLARAIEYIQPIVSGLPFQTWWYYLFNDHALYLEPLASAYFRAGDLEKALETYEQIIGLTAGRIKHGDVYAKSFYMLGKIYEEQGNRAKAIESYEKFLNLWKEADPGFVEVEDARKRLSEINK